MGGWRVRRRGLGWRRGRWLGGRWSLGFGRRWWRLVGVGCARRMGWAARSTLRLRRGGNCRSWAVGMAMAMLRVVRRAARRSRPYRRRRGWMRWWRRWWGIWCGRGGRSTRAWSGLVVGWCVIRWPGWIRRWSRSSRDAGRLRASAVPPAPLVNMDGDAPPASSWRSSDVGGVSLSVVLSRPCLRHMTLDRSASARHSPRRAFVCPGRLRRFACAPSSSDAPVCIDAAESAAGERSRAVRVVRALRAGRVHEVRRGGEADGAV